MNEKGFGITAVFAFAAFSIVVIFIFYNFITGAVSGFLNVNSGIPNYHNEYSVYSEKKYNQITNNPNNGINYSELEIVVEDAARNYMQTYYADIYGKDVLYINVNSLEQMSYLTNLNDGTNKCNGYVKVLKDNNNLLVYNAYLKCGYSYTTHGYNSSFDK
jgi:hypothetical protein